MSDLTTPTVSTDDIIRQLKKEQTRLRRSLKSMASQKEKYLILFNKATDCILLWRGGGSEEVPEIVDCNEAACRYFGYKRSELLGRPRITVTPEYLVFSPDLLRTLREQKPVSFLANHVHKNGQTILSEVHLQIADLHDRDYTYGIAVIRDITERIQSEQKLSESLGREKKLRQKLELEANQRIDFTRALVHELKTPITSMMTLSELIIQNTKDDDISQYANCLIKGIEDLDYRIDELMNVAKGEVGILRPDYSLIDFKSFIQEMYQSMNPRFLVAKQTFTLDCPNRIPNVIADGRLLRHVVMNLLDNAAKYTPRGGTISLIVTVIKDQLVVSIKDTGQGMNNDEIRCLFQSYTRHPNKHHGLGIGLALSKMIIESHKGEIKVESELGKGSIFTFSIPIRPEQNEITNS